MCEVEYSQFGLWHWEGSKSGLMYPTIRDMWPDPTLKKKQIDHLFNWSLLKNALDPTTAHD
jgi:hypothetical protein